MATVTMWSPNIAAFSKEYRVYAIDVMGQPSKSIPGQPICNAADFVSWLTATLDALQLDRVFLIGMSFGGWLALNYAVAAPQRVRKLVLLSPGGLLPMVRQFAMRGMLMVFFTTRLTVNSFFRWLGITDRTFPKVLDLMYLGMKHFRMPLETARVGPSVISDEDLRTLHVPTLILYGEHESSAIRQGLWNARAVSSLSARANWCHGLVTRCAPASMKSWIPGFSISSTIGTAASPNASLPDSRRGR
jgi:pimeloyl-ACP methyl ester carboxylesterase